MLATERIRLGVSEAQLPPDIRQILEVVDHPDFTVERVSGSGVDAVIAHVDHIAREALDERDLILMGPPEALAPLEAHPHVVCTIDWPNDTSLVRLLAGCARSLRRERRLRTLAYSDALTGLLNRRGFEEQADRSIARARYDGPASALLMIDIDHFKAINDRHGHAAGDAVLRHLGALIQRQVRPGDVIARIGGEELAILLPGATLDEAVAAAERVRAAVAGATIRFGRKALLVTVSIGVASTGLADHHRPAMRAADEALYRAKAQGRNCVVAAPKPLFWQTAAAQLKERVFGRDDDDKPTPLHS